MAETGYAAFNKTVDKTNHILRKIEETYGWPKERRNQSYAALRTVLQALRDRLTVEEIPQLGAQLPMLVKGIYYGRGNYNQDLGPRTLLIEVGAHTNSRIRAERGAAMFATVLDRTLARRPR